MVLPTIPTRWAGQVARGIAAAATRARRHPFPVRTHFRHSLVITWAFPPEALQPLCVEGLELDTYTDPTGETHAFAAVALVDLDHLRLAGGPAWVGTSHRMAGYRVFTKLRQHRARGAGETTLRGLRILASQTSDPLSMIGANLSTRYHYQVAKASMTCTYGVLRAEFRADRGRADIVATAYLGDPTLPAESPFATAADARRFAGPLPYTFSPDPDGLVVVKSSRTDWHPEPVRVDVAEATFFEQGRFAGVPRRLANAFHLADLDYGWQPGVLHRRR